MPIHELIAALALALTLGGMTFFSGVIAPLVFIKLPAQTAAGFIRAIFPWYYLTMGVTSAVALALLLAGARGETWPVLLCAFVVVGFVFSRQILMPQINRARDQRSSSDTGAGARFARLHRLSVFINAAQLIAVLVALILLLS